MKERKKEQKKKERRKKERKKEYLVNLLHVSNLRIIRDALPQHVEYFGVALTGQGNERNIMQARRRNTWF